jgi:hypothetical protein
MSALPPKADICSALTHVRYGPIGGLMQRSKKKDHLAAVFPNIDGVETQCSLIRIEPGWPDSLNRFTGVIFVPSTLKIDKS